MILILSVAAFGYSQYSAITSISSTMINSQDMGAVPLGHMYKIQIDFENPSLLMLAIGESEFTISADGKNIGDGKLDPFYLVALGEGTAYGAISKLWQNTVNTQKLPRLELKSWQRRSFYRISFF